MVSGAGHERPAPLLDAVSRRLSFMRMTQFMLRDVPARKRASATGRPYSAIRRRD